MNHTFSYRPDFQIKRNPLACLLSFWLVCVVASGFEVRARAGFIFNSLAAFNATNGYTPMGPLYQAPSGDFYGTTRFGGSGYNAATTNAGFGTVFKYNLASGVTTLSSFNSNNGAYPSSGLIQTSNGLFYGTTTAGGTYNVGTVFRVNGSGAISNMASFDGTNGNNPNGLTKLNDQTFYGLSYLGGTPMGNFFSLGTLFKVDTNGALNLVKKFDGSTNGSNPFSTMVQAKDGTFFGTTSSGSGNNIYGTTFHFFTNGTLTVLDVFGYTNGADPTSLVMGQDGNCYGTANQGGKFSFYGTIFRMSTNGALTNLYNFDSTNSGAGPGSLVQGRNGVLYGVTASGGSFGNGTNNGGGTVFQITTNGQFSVLYVFTNGVDGSGPAGLIVGSDDNLYGTTSYGGSNGFGAVFSLTINPVNPVITSVRSTGGLITINWSASAGYVYNVLYKNKLTATNWSVLTTVTASNSVGVATDIIGTNASRYYRVELLQNIAPTITSITDNAGHVTIKWAAFEGYTYEVYYKTSLVQTNWTALQIVTATNTTAVATDNSAGGFSRYYNVIVVSPAPNIKYFNVGRTKTTLEWVALPGSAYNVLFKSSLKGNWSVLQTVTASGTTGLTSFNTPTNSTGFFQVQFAP